MRRRRRPSWAAWMCRWLGHKPYVSVMTIAGVELQSWPACERCRVLL